jgi:hypothetical protein
MRRFVLSGIVRLGNNSTSGAAFAVFDLKTPQALYDEAGQLNTI